MNKQLKKAYGHQILPFNLPLDDLHGLHNPEYYIDWIEPSLRKERRVVTYVRLCMLAELERWYSITEEKFEQYKSKPGAEPNWEPMIFTFSPKRGKYFYYNRHIPTMMKVAEYSFYLAGANETFKGKTHQLVFDFINAN